MKIADNVEMLEVPAPAMHHPVLVWDAHDVVLIDTSFPGQLDALAAEVARCGFSLDRITKVILTHQDVDHIGNLKALREHGAEILAGEHEAPFIRGDLPLTKLTDMEAHLDHLPPEQLGFYDMLKKAGPALCAPVDTLLADGQKLPACGGIRVVFTPGHTPGHIVLLLTGTNIAVCGDAANVTDRQLTGSVPELTHNLTDAAASLEKIKALGAAGYACYHTGYLAMS